MNSEFARQSGRQLQRLQCVLGRLSAPGLIGGMLLVSWLHQYAAAFGAERISRMALAGAAGMGAALAVWWFSPNANAKRRDSSSPALQASLMLILAAWTVCFPWLVGMAARAVGLISSTLLERPLVQLTALGGAAAILIGAPIAVLAGLLAGHRRNKTHVRAASRAPERWFGDELVAVALGMVLLLLLVVYVAPWLGSWLGIHRAAMIAALVGAVWEIVALTRLYRSTGSEGDELADDVGIDCSRKRAAAAIITAHATAVERWLAVLCVMASGVAISAFSRAVHQLLPTTEWLVLVRVAVLIAAAGLSWQWGMRRRRADAATGRVAPEAVCLVALSLMTLWPLVFLAAFPGLVDVALLASVHVSRLGWSILIQAGLVALCFAPVGWAVGMAARVLFGNQGIDTQRDVSPAGAGTERVSRLVAPTALALGFAVTEGWLVMRFGPAATLMVLSGVCLLGAGFAWLCTLPAMRPRRSRMVAMIAGGVVLGAFAPAGYDPARSARLLFSSRMFAAVRGGISNELLPYVDEARCAMLIEGDDGTISAWKYRGAQYQVRESGIPKATVSTNANVCPQFSTTVMQAAIPLAVHPHPRRVMLLGLGAGTTLETCLAFPVQSITCMEPDRALISFIRSLATERTGGDPLDDERVQVRHLSPPLAVLNSTERYDVIISHADQAALWKSGSTLTRDFYFRTANCLAEDGVFCQQFQVIDFGAEPMQVMAATWRSAFRHVMAMETAPGEMIFLGTNSAAGLAPADLVETLQAPHMRRTLAWMGWDWAMPLNLPAYSDSGLGRMAEPVRSGGNTAASGMLSLTLPFEVLRWTDKHVQRQSLLGPNTERLLDWTSEGEPDADVLRRFSEIAAQQNLMQQYPDEYWMYRKAVREQIVERPRSLVQQIQQASFDRTLHPDDARRLKYFERLGVAKQQKQPTAEAILAVGQHAEPYDPLISYFLHQEVAELYKRSGTQSVAEELSHRLYAVFHASPTDRSVRNVAAAITLLMKHPEAIPDSVRRWDVLNALQQMMLTRWEARGAVSPRSSRVVLNDIEISLEAIEASLPVMRSLTAEAGLTEYDWDAREQVLERALVRPLHTYHGQVLPHHVRTRRRLAELQQRGDDVGSDSATGDAGQGADGEAARDENLQGPAGASSPEEGGM